MPRLTQICHLAVVFTAMLMFCAVPCAPRPYYGVVNVAPTGSIYGWWHTPAQGRVHPWYQRFQGWTRTWKGVRRHPYPHSLTERSSSETRMTEEPSGRDELLCEALSNKLERLNCTDKENRRQSDCLVLSRLAQTLHKLCGQGEEDSQYNNTELRQVRSSTEPVMAHEESSTWDKRLCALLTAKREALQCDGEQQLKWGLKSLCVAIRKAFELVYPKCQPTTKTTTTKTTTATTTTVTPTTTTSTTTLTPTSTPTTTTPTTTTTTHTTTSTTPTTATTPTTTPATTTTAQTTTTPTTTATTPATSTTTPTTTPTTTRTTPTTTSTTTTPPPPPPTTTTTTSTPTSTTTITSSTTTTPPTVFTCELNAFVCRAGALCLDDEITDRSFTCPQNFGCCRPSLFIFPVG